MKVKRWKISIQPSSKPSSQPSSQPSSEPSSQPSSQPSYSGFPLDGSLTITKGLAVTSGTGPIYSPDGLYQLLLTGGSTNPGDLRLRSCTTRFDTNTGQCTAGGTTAVLWKSETGDQDIGTVGAGGTVAVLQNDGNLVVYDGSSPPGASWFSNTCATCSIGGQGTRLYLPGPTSVCECDNLMCIVVDLTAGGVDYYYAVTNGDFFTKLTACPP